MFLKRLRFRPVNLPQLIKTVRVKVGVTEPVCMLAIDEMFPRHYLCKIVTILYTYIVYFTPLKYFFEFYKSSTPAVPTLSSSKYKNPALENYTGLNNLTR